MKRGWLNTSGYYVFIVEINILISHLNFFFSLLSFQVYIIFMEFEFFMLSLFFILIYLFFIGEVIYTYPETLNESLTFESTRTCDGIQIQENKIVLLYTKDQMREECVSWWYEIIKLRMHKCRSHWKLNGESSFQNSWETECITVYIF